ncbi:MAG: hypothetical protein HKL90_11805 [Elusimicrobia bacterium]|nr:hypothetical protein [Elusimicrobiota bacterium]
MVRTIYLLAINDLAERRRLIRQTLKGERWRIKGANGKSRKVTDREMVELAQKLRGWTKSVYRFGCAFTHLSDFHNHFAQNPFDGLSEYERFDVLAHMRQYHGGPESDNPNMNELSIYIPMVFRKISENLLCYVEHLERDEVGTAEYL